VYPIRKSTFGLTESAIGLIYSRGAGAKVKAAASLVKNLIAVARAR
jgi:hypothetical protein